MARKSFLTKHRKSDRTTRKPETAQAPSPRKGDLDGDGDVDWVDRVIAAVQFIQTPKGQCLILIGAAVFSLVINLSTYTRSMQIAFDYLNIEWMVSLSWLAAIVSYLLIQVLETMPRTN